MSGTFFDDLAVGDVLAGGARTVTDAEVAMLPALMGVISPLFHDEETARESRFGGRVLYGPALLGIGIGLTEPLFKDAALGLVSLNEVSFVKPVRVGDTVSARLTVCELHPSASRPSGRATVADEIVNQHGQSVLTFTRVLMLRARG